MGVQPLELEDRYGKQKPVPTIQEEMSGLLCHLNVHKSVEPEGIPTQST